MPDISPNSYDESHTDPVIGAHLYRTEFLRIDDDRAFLRYIKSMTPQSSLQDDLTLQKMNDSLARQYSIY